MASSLFGRTSLRDIVTSRVGSEVKVVFGGKSTATDGKKIKVADLPDSEDEIVRLTAEVSAYHESEHVRVLQEVSKDKKSIFFGAQDIGEMIKRGLAKAKLDPKHHNAFGTLWNVFEDIRIDRRANDRWPGTTEKYQQVEAHLWEKQMKTFSKRDPISKVSLMAITKGRDMYYETLGYNKAAIPFDPKDELIYRTTLGKLEKKVAKMVTVEDSMNLALEALEILKNSFTPPPPPPPQPQPPQDSEGEEGEGEGDESKGKGKGKKSKPKKEEPEDNEDSEGEGEGEPEGGSSEDEEDSEGKGSKSDKGEEDGEESEEGSGDGESDGDKGSKGDPGSEGNSGEEPGGSGEESDGAEGESDDGDGSETGEESGSGSSDDPSQGESDGLSEEDSQEKGGSSSSVGASNQEETCPPDPNAFDKHKDVLDLGGERLDQINEEADDFYSVHPDIEDTYQGAPSVNQAQGNSWLAQGKPYFGGTEAKIRTLLMDEKAPKVINSLPRGKKIDTSHLYRHNDYRFGKQPQIWRTRLNGSNIETAIRFSIDESGSMRGQSWHTQCSILAALCGILDTCNVKYKVTGWTDGGYMSNDVNQENKCQRDWANKYREYNDWGVRLNPGVLPVYPMDNGTPTVDDIINGLTELSTRREARKVFILFTDGDPSYYGKMAPAAYNYAKDMLDRARQAGYKVFGFGIGVHQSHPLMNFLFKEGWVGIDSQANPGDEAVKIMERLREAFL